MTWRQRLEQYGKLGVYVYFTVFFVTLGSFALALHFGLQDHLPWLATHAGSGATFVAAYALTKVVQIPRLAFTLAITPILARRLGKA